MFGKEKLLIGMIHSPPLIGFEGYPGEDYIINQALENMYNLENGGIDAILIENNYDLSHTKYLDTEIIVQLTYIAQILRKQTNLPMGICCLWNDWKASLSIAKIVGLQFVRIPVFVDHIKIHYGYEIKENTQDIINFRKKIGAEDIKIFTDIQVKHSQLLNQRPLVQSATDAINNGSDGLIITGNWTGDFPNYGNLKDVRENVGDFPIIIGSGTTPENIQQGLKYADATIIGTYLKTSSHGKHDINLKSWEEKIDMGKVRKIVESK